MSHENGAGKACHFLTGSGSKASRTYRFSKETRNHLDKLSLAKGLKKTQYLEDLILKQKLKK